MNFVFFFKEIMSHLVKLLQNASRHTPAPPKMYFWPMMTRSRVHPPGISSGGEHHHLFLSKPLDGRQSKIHQEDDHQAQLQQGFQYVLDS